MSGRLRGVGLPGRRDARPRRRPLARARPRGADGPAWHLFALFLGSIVAVVAGALPILTSSVLAVGAAVLSGTLTPAGAYAGFANGTILLIIVAFLVARAVVKCGLGERLGYVVVSLFGKSTLGLGYSVFLLDAVIAPAFPSNTARGGVLYPIVYSLARGGGSQPDEATRKRMGAYLMFCGMASLTVSSALWLTAMAANPLGAEMSRVHGLDDRLRLVARRRLRPDAPLPRRPPAPPLQGLSARGEVDPRGAGRGARGAPKSSAPSAPDEKVVAATFVAMVVAWGLAGTLKLDSTAIAFAGLGVLLAAGALTLKDISQEGDVLATFIWFAVLYGMSAQLNELGFMGFLGQKLAGALGGLPWLGAYLVLLVAYVLLHYLFVSQTAHLLALFGVFLDVGVKLGVPVAPLAFALLFATNYFSVLTPQGSSANLLFAGSGYLTQGELYRLGAITTVFSFLVYAVAGTPWVLLVDALRAHRSEMTWFLDALRQNPELAIFLTLAIGFLIGRLKIGSFTLGNVVGTLIAGVVVGQIGVDVHPLVKIVFFDLFLFATGYKVGPQFFRGLKKNALSQVSLTVVLCVTSLLTTVVAAKIFKYDVGTAAGLMAGAFTESTVIGTAGDAIGRLDISEAEKTRLRNNIPVAYAVSLPRRHRLRRLVPLEPRAAPPEGEPEGGGPEARGAAGGRAEAATPGRSRPTGEWSHPRLPCSTTAPSRGGRSRTSRRRCREQRIFVKRIRRGGGARRAAARDAGSQRGDVVAVAARRHVLLDAGVSVRDRGRGPGAPRLPARDAGRRRHEPGRRRPDARGARRVARARRRPHEARPGRRGDPVRGLDRRSTAATSSGSPARRRTWSAPGRRSATSSARRARRTSSSSASASSSAASSAS